MTITELADAYERLADQAARDLAHLADARRRANAATLTSTTPTTEDHR